MPKLRATPEQKETRRFNGFVQANRTVLKLRQEDIGKAVGLSQSAISNRLNEETDWTLQEMFKVCEFFGETYTIGVQK